MKNQKGNATFYLKHEMGWEELGVGEEEWGETEADK